jgi:hypothetical protein
MIKTAHLTLDTLGMMAVKTTYDERLVALIRKIPGMGRHWDKDRKVWLIHVEYHDYLVMVLKELNYAITDEVRAGAAMRRSEDEPGIWLMAGTPGVRPIRVQCPACQEIQDVGCYRLYEDTLRIKRLQFYGSGCCHAWELCFQARDGRLWTWAEAVEVPTCPIAEDGADTRDAEDRDEPPPHLRAVLDAVREQREGFHFETWFKRAMGADEV